MGKGRGGKGEEERGKKRGGEGKGRGGMVGKEGVNLTHFAFRTLAALCLRVLEIRLRVCQIF